MIIKKMPNKKSPDMSIAISEKVVVNKPITNGKVVSFLGTNTTILDISKVTANMLHLGATNNIKCDSFYVDSEGNLTKKAICEGQVITEFEYSLDNFNFICLENNNEDYYIEEKSNVSTRAPRVKVNSDSIELCEIKLGYFRKYYKDNTANLIVGVRTYYDKNSGVKKDNDKDGNIDYRSMLTCSPENKIVAIEHIKNIAKQDKAITFEWFV